MSRIKTMSLIVLMVFAGAQFNYASGWSKDCLGAQKTTRFLANQNLAYRLLKRAKNIVAISLIVDNVFIANMALEDVNKVRHSLKSAILSDSVTMTPPPWNALLEIKFRDGERLYALLLSSHILRVGNSRTLECYNAGDTRYHELSLGDDETTYLWIGKVLGATSVKQYQTDGPIPPFPGP